MSRPLVVVASDKRRHAALDQLVDELEIAWVEILELSTISWSISSSSTGSRLPAAMLSTHFLTISPGSTHARFAFVVSGSL